MDYSVMLKKFIGYATAIIFVAIFVSGCGGGGNAELADNRFNGTFRYSYDWVAPNGINEVHYRDTLVFDGSSFAQNTRYVKVYSASYGWKYTGNYIGDSVKRIVEFEVDGVGQRFRYRISEGPLAYDTRDWSDWSGYSFSSDGKMLTLTGIYSYYLNSLNSVTLIRQ